MTAPRIVPASSSTAAVVGVHDGLRPEGAVAVESFDDFLELLGPPETTLPARPAAPGPVPAAVRGFFENGGRRLYVSLVADDSVLPAAIAALPEIPDLALMAAPGHSSDAVHAALVRAAAARPGLFAVLDPPPGLAAGELAAWAKRRSTGAAAIYAPWLVVEGPGGERTVPPSGHVLGVLARVADRRGIRKAPAGLDAALLGVRRRAQELGHADQALLHEQGVNVLRDTPSAGLVIWGARTLGGVGPSRHVPVVRTLSWLARSLDVGMRWVAEREHGEALWSDVREVAEAFLEEVRSEGGLAGTPEQAYAVRCDRTTMTDADLAAGRLVMLIGVAPTRPGEFVTLRMLQLTRGGSTPSP